MFRIVSTLCVFLLCASCGLADDSQLPSSVDAAVAVDAEMTIFERIHVHEEKLLAKKPLFDSYAQPLAITAGSFLGVILVGFMMLGSISFFKRADERECGIRLLLLLFAAVLAGLSFGIMTLGPGAVAKPLVSHFAQCCYMATLGVFGLCLLLYLLICFMRMRTPRRWDNSVITTLLLIALLPVTAQAQTLGFDAMQEGQIAQRIGPPVMHQAVSPEEETSEEEVDDLLETSPEELRETPVMYHWRWIVGGGLLVLLGLLCILAFCMSRPQNRHPSQTDYQ